MLRCLGVPQLLSLTPMVPGCSRVSPFRALLAVTQFVFLGSVPLADSHWPETSPPSFSFPSHCLAWSTSHSYSPGWIPGCVPSGGFVLQSVVRRSPLTVTSSPRLPNRKCPKSHSSSTLSSLCCPLPSSQRSPCSVWP